MIVDNRTTLRKLYHSLNLDYPQNGLSAESQTNALINQIMVRFISKYKDDFNNKYVILESQNDTLTLLAYTLLKNIQVIEPFQLLIFGKRHYLKKYIRKQKIKEKFIAKKQFDKLNQNNKVIFVSCYNPIYKVVNKKNNFNKNDNTFEILKDFTPKEIQISNNFYNIKITRNDIKFSKNSLIKQYDIFCNGFLEIKSDLLPFEIYNKKYPIYIVKFYENDMDKNKEILDTIVETDGMVFYYCEKSEDKYPILSSNFQFFLKNKSNIPNKKYYNINSYGIVKQLYDENGLLEKPIFLGDFSPEEKDMWISRRLR